MIAAQGEELAKAQTAEGRRCEDRRVAPDPHSESDMSEARKLLDKTEAIYSILWRVNTLLKTLPQLKNFKPAGVGNTRNNLMEHTGGKGSGAHIYSFRIGTGGPVLRPTKPAGSASPADNGLEKNAAEYLTQLVARVKPAGASQ
jgi:hypothetical protein